MNISNAMLIRLIGFVLALLWIVVLSFVLPVDSGANGEAVSFSWHAFLIATEDPMYPFNIQVMMWIAFFYCLAELIIKWINLSEENLQLELFDLYRNPDHVLMKSAQGEVAIPLDRDEALKPELLAAIYYAKRKLVPEHSLIGGFFKKINHQFQSTNDVGDVYSAVNSMIELKLHEVDLRYTVIRYLAWLIPTLGFIGTVIGIAVALGQAGVMGSDDPELLQAVIPLLATAFYTTLLALLLSAVVMIAIQWVQAKDEETVNNAGSLCLDAIVTNLKPRSSGHD
ncbi:MotA/TolQ/ExbB proton channel family protein [Marinobacter mobilis]|uniref:MotA/TolQ/ExbB proton channel family protein n=1 Tax=Marinobacter mobilis TaxID=488533 RepID=A0A1H3AV85_9GAMM|nr:MotA/TolQ/ExbB proton channel family protein [Marinobacter mobilis]SDX32749.1 MotA/TolQ/ExbB proton channel family protein [Marinobacter mobilis]